MALRSGMQVTLKHSALTSSTVPREPSLSNRLQRRRCHRLSDTSWDVGSGRRPGSWRFGGDVGAEVQGANSLSRARTEEEKPKTSDKEKA